MDSNYRGIVVFYWRCEIFDEYFRRLQVDEEPQFNNKLWYFFLILTVVDFGSFLKNKIQLGCMTYLYYSTHSFHADCLDANTIRYNTR